MAALQGPGPDDHRAGHPDGGRRAPAERIWAGPAPGAGPAQMPAFRPGRHGSRAEGEDAAGPGYNRLRCDGDARASRAPSGLLHSRWP